MSGNDDTFQNASDHGREESARSPASGDEPDGSEGAEPPSRLQQPDQSESAAAPAFRDADSDEEGAVAEAGAFAESPCDFSVDAVWQAGSPPEGSKRSGDEHASRLAEMLERVAAEAGVRTGCLSVRVIDDAAMSRAHGEWLGDEATTDVITFDLLPSELSGVAGCVEGELLICADEAARQSARLGHGFADELLLYGVHGLLHLCGEDDKTEQGASRMHAAEDELLTRVGVGAVYASSREDASASPPASPENGS
jgi:probable rRNA maturation factor